MSFASVYALQTATILKVKVGYSTAAIAVFGLSTLSAISGYAAIKAWVASGVQTQEKIDFTQLGFFIEDWATRRAAWAAKGIRDDGSAYSLDRWVQEGQGYVQDAFYRANLAFNDSFFSDAYTSAVSLVQNLPKDLSKLGDPTAWPWYVGAGIGVVALFYGSQIIRNLRAK